MIQGGWAVAHVKQDVGKKEVMEDLGEGVILPAGCKVASRRQGHQRVGQIVEVASPRNLKATKSGRNGRISKRKSQQGSSCFKFCPSLTFCLRSTSIFE